MTTRIHSELRKLALAYYRGWIERDKYVSIRKDYLRAISKGEIPAKIDPKKIAPPKRQPASGGARRGKSSQKKWLFIGIGACLLILVIIVIISGGNDTKSLQSQSGTSVKQAPTKAQKPKQVTDEQRFISFMADNFVEQRSWKPDALNSLRLKWLGLSQEQQKTVRATKTFKDFSGALIERIVDERGLDNIVPSDYELSLMTVAKNIGVTEAIPSR